MSFFQSVFGNAYNQASLLVMVVGLVINVSIDVIKAKDKADDTDSSE